MLPNIDKLRIPREKLTNYALDFEKDKNKAAAFQLALGYNKTNVDVLIADIMKGVKMSEAIPKGDDGFGMRYEVILTLTGPNGKSANVLTAWLDDHKLDEVRLISAYIDKKKVG